MQKSPSDSELVTVKSCCKIQYVHSWTFRYLAAKASDVRDMDSNPARGMAQFPCWFWPQDIKQENSKSSDNHKSTSRELKDISTPQANKLNKSLLYSKYTYLYESYNIY